MIIYFVPTGGVAQRSVLIEYPGPKRYRRVWLDQPEGTDDWTWHLPPNAVRVWDDEDETP